MRIDKHPVHNFQYTMSFAKGVPIYTATVVNFDDDDGGAALFDEMASGSTMRFIEGQGKNDSLIKFSLNGFSEALERTLAQCKAFKGNKR
jgi:invasion protein IalB